MARSSAAALPNLRERDTTTVRSCRPTGGIWRFCGQPRSGALRSSSCRWRPVPPWAAPRANSPTATTVCGASPGRRKGANSCSRLADISALHGLRGSGWRTRVDRLAPNPSRSASRPPGSTSPGQAGSCIQHRSEIRRFTSLRFQGHRGASGRARRLQLDLRRTHAGLFSARETARIRVDAIRNGGDPDCEQGRVKSVAGHVHGRRAVRESPVVAGRTDDSLRLATNGPPDLYLLQPDNGKPVA